MNTFTLILTMLMIQTYTLFDFAKTSSSDQWRVVDDVVMGGRSHGDFKITKEGHGKFSGYVSLENNGGFSSVQHAFKTITVSKFSKVILRVKGDGKTYQFRVKASKQDYAAYIYEFKTTKDWMSIEIPFKAMSPKFRGRKLNQPNFQGQQMEEIAFLIGNKKEQSFELLIDTIELD